MKKFAKMSLVAAIAVAGMTSANAKDLTEAIKNVDVSGTVVYRYDDKSVDSGTSTVSNNYKIGMTLKSKVNDDITATTRFLVAGDNGGFVNGGLDPQSEGDSNPGVTLSWVNFSYTGIKNTTVIVGKQGLATPWTNAVDSDGSEQTGTGILGLTTWGPVTAAAGYFNQTNVTAGGENLVVAALIGNFAGVNTEAWYLDVDDVLDSYYFGANYKLNLDSVKLGFDGKYTSMEKEADTSKDYGNWELGLTAKMGMFNAGVAYAETEEDGSGILNSVAKNGQIGYSVNIKDAEDADMWMFDLGAQVTPKLHIGLNYDEVDGVNDNDDQEETFVQATYKMSKNFMTYVRLADGEKDSVDYNRGRLQVQYSF